MPIGNKKYVILSASEISHRTIALLVVIARHEVPIGDKKYVILSASEISHRTIDKPNILSLRAVGAANSREGGFP